MGLNPNPSRRVHIAGAGTCAEATHTMFKRIAIFVSLNFAIVTLLLLSYGGAPTP